MNIVDLAILKKMVAGGGGVSSVNVTGASGSHIESSGGPITDSGTIELNISTGYSIPSDDKQTAWDGKAVDIALSIDSSTYVVTAQLKDAGGALIGTAKTIDLPLESVVVSGTYDDQTKKVILTLQNGSTIEFSVADLVSGLQTELNDTDNKLNPDYIAYDASHRAVSDTEKDTWNAKQNAISDLETIRSGAAAGATAVQPATMSEALAAKQNSLNTAQLAAVNSGIDSDDVAQISTNQTNILYGIRTGSKNQLKLTGDVWNPNTLNVYWDYTNGTVRITGSTATTDAVFINCGSWTAPEDGVYRLFANSAACTANIRVYDDVLWNTFENAGGGASNEATWTKGTTRSIYIRIAKGVVVGDVTVTPMICQKSVFDADPSFAPYAAPNYDLTYLQAEDRAALAEEIDAGAKNKFNPSGVSTFTNMSQNNYTFTATTTDTRTIFYMRAIAYNGSTSLGSMLFEDTITTNGTYSYEFTKTASFNSIKFGHTGSSTDFYIQFDISALTNGVTYVFQFKLTQYNPSNTLAYTDVMICTKAAFCVSPAFVPYKTTFDNNIKKVATWVTSFSVSVTAGTMKYLYVRGGNPTKMGIYLLESKYSNTGTVTEIVSGSFASLSVTYNSTTNTFDCTTSVTVEAWTQLYLLP